MTEPAWILWALGALLIGTSPIDHRHRPSWGAVFAGLVWPAATILVVGSRIVKAAREGLRG